MFAQSLCLYLYIWTWNIGCKTRKTLKKCIYDYHNLILVCSPNLNLFTQVKRSPPGSKSCHLGEDVIGRTRPLDTALPLCMWYVVCGGEAVSWDRVLSVRSSTTSSSRRQYDGGGGACLNTCDCRLHFPSVWGKIWWYCGVIKSISLLGTIVLSQNRSSLHSMIAKGVRIGIDPLPSQDSC